MARANTVQTNFTSGEISPLMYGRVDTTKYFNGARKLTNMLVLPQGGAFRRPAARYFGATRDADSDGNTNFAVLKKFIPDGNNAFVLEFTDQKLRFWNSSGLLGAPLEVVSPFLEADLNYLVLAQSADVAYITCPGYPVYKLSYISNSNWTLAAVTFNDGPWLDTDTSGVVLRILGVSTDTDVIDIVTIKSNSSTFVIGDVGKFVEYKDTADGTNWRLAKISAYVSGTEVVAQLLQNILIPNVAAKIRVASGNVKSDLAGVFTPQDIGKYIRLTVNIGATDNDPAVEGASTWYLTTGLIDDSGMKAGSAVTLKTYSYPTVVLTVQNDRLITGRLSASSALFVSGDVGLKFRLKIDNRSVIATVGSYTSSTLVSVTLSDYPPLDPTNNLNLANAGRTTSFRRSAWSSVNGYPTCCSFHGGRLWFGGSILQPTTMWGSESDDYESMSPNEITTGNVLDSNAITITIASAEVSPVRWIKSGPVLLVGTETNEYQVKPNSLLQAISPTNVIVVPQTSFGTTTTQNNSMRIGSAVIFAQSGGGKLREMSYDFNTDAYISKDISIISEHLFRSTLQLGLFHVPALPQGVVCMDIGVNPFTVGWFVMVDGSVVSMTYDKEQDVIAFTQHYIGKTNNGHAVVESLAVMPNPKSGSDYIFMSVARTINGKAKRFIEYFPLINSISPLSGVVWPYIDGFTINSTTGAIVNSVGWDNYNGAVVQVVVDGVYIGTKTVGTVSGGIGFALNLTVASYVAVGYQYNGLIELVDPEGGSQAGSSQGKKKRVVNTTVRMMNCPHPKLGSCAGATNVEQTVTSIDSPVTFRKIIADPSSGAPLSYTGDFHLTTDDGFNSNGRLALQQDEPYAFNILGVFHKLDTDE